MEVNEKNNKDKDSNKNKILQIPLFWALLAWGLTNLLYFYHSELLLGADIISIITISFIYTLSAKSSITKKFILKFSIYYALLFILQFILNAIISIYSFHNISLIISNLTYIISVFDRTLVQSLVRFLFSLILLFFFYYIINYKIILNFFIRLFSALFNFVKKISSKFIGLFKNPSLGIIILLVILIFALFNVLIFGKIVVRESKNTINKEARMYFASAYAINNIYIFPLSKSFGFLSPITKPFYMVRNFLYDKGLNKLAPADGESEWWWGRIKEQEFVELYMQAMFDWNYKNILPRKKADELLRMEDEVYTHLLNIPNANPYDKSLKKENYLMFIETGYRYATYFSYLPHKLQRDYNIDYTDRQIRHFEKVYDTYLKYKDYALKNEKASIQFVPKDNKLTMREPEFISQLLWSLLSSLDKENNLSCDCEYLPVFTRTQSDILDYLINNSSKINYDYLLDLNLQLTPFAYSKKTEMRCKNSTNFKSYKKFLEKKDEYQNRKTKKRG